MPDIPALTEADLVQRADECGTRVHKLAARKAQAKRDIRSESKALAEARALRGAAGRKMASQRIKLKRDSAQQQLDSGIEILIHQQDSSIRAMNVARLLSPEFEDKLHFRRAIKPKSKDGIRLEKLLKG
jgi:hypothetical protein